MRRRRCAQQVLVCIAVNCLFLALMLQAESFGMEIAKVWEGVPEAQPGSLLRMHLATCTQVMVTKCRLLEQSSDVKDLLGKLQGWLEQLEGTGQVEVEVVKVRLSADWSVQKLCKCCVLWIPGATLHCGVYGSSSNLVFRGAQSI